MYSDEDVKRMQVLGFTLSGIYKLLGVVDKDEACCEDMFEFVSKKKRKFNSR
jgi:MerR family mercuric resistance operon transcriptional regulator